MLLNQECSKQSVRQPCWQGPARTGRSQPKLVGLGWASLETVPGSPAHLAVPITGTVPRCKGTTPLWKEGSVGLLTSSWCKHLCSVLCPKLPTVASPIPLVI